MELKEMIGRRRSVRAYEKQPLEESQLAEIRAFMAKAVPLDASIAVHAEILDKAHVTLLQKWDAPHYISVCSEDRPGWLENVGFMFQQVDLYLQSQSLGSCWVGMGWPDESLVPSGMKHAILMPFGKPKSVPERTCAEDFRRKAMGEIADYPDDRLEAARLAPSACNSQPWYFVHAGENVLHVYREELNVIKRRMLGKYNPMDVGIALAHLMLTNDAFAFRREKDPPLKDGFIYMGTVELN